MWQIDRKYYQKIYAPSAVLVKPPTLSTTWHLNRLYHPLWITNLHPEPKYQPDTMAPRSTEEINGKLLMKIGTLACFLLAGALLITSLFVPPPAQSGIDGETSQGITASIR